MIRSDVKILFDIDEVKELIATQDSSKDIGNGLDDSKLHIKHAFDVYIPATKRISKWCESTLPLLHQIINEDGPSRSQKNLLLGTLDNGIKRALVSLEELQNITLSYDNVIEVFDNLMGQIAENHNISDFQKKKVQNLYNDVANLKLQFELEVQITDAMEHHMQDTSIYLLLTNNLFNKYPNLHETIHESIKRLIAAINSYRKRHAWANRQR